MNGEAELLRRYADDKSQEAFAELVRRKVDLVYAAALRQTGGDAHLAQDVTQGVFLALARRASSLQRHAVLTGWLYTTTRFLATKAVRAQVRWQRREQEANTMDAISTGPEPKWEELRPVIDEAMHELGEPDRTAILLRYFEGLPLARVGAALGSSENAARMRVDRAMEKLRERLMRRGITSTAAALGTALAAQPTVAAPLELAAAAAKLGIGAPAIVTAGGTGGVLTMTKFFVVGSVAALFGLGYYLIAENRLHARIAAETLAEERQVSGLQAENRDLKGQTPSRSAERNTSLPPEQLPQLLRLRALAALNKSRAIGRLQWAPGGNSSLFITPEISKLLALTPTETAELRQEIASAQKDLAALALAEATVHRSENVIVVDLEPNGAIRARYARLMEAVRSRLGVERFQYFEDVGLTTSLDALFFNFGLISKRYVVGRDSSRPDAPYYTFSRSTLGANPNAPVEAEARGGTLDRAALREKLGPMDVLVPLDF
jgi:RNA polymerase sigma factor (sigma-70 family)